MCELQRIQVGEFNISQAITINEVENNKEYADNKIITVKDFFKEYEIIQLDDRKLKLFLNGVQITIKKENNIYNIYNNNKFIGTGIINNNLLKRDIII